jgi:YVTN family beta-propeller protein
MKNLSLLIALVFSLQVIGQVKTPDKTLLPNGWSLSPAGRSFPLGDLPLNIAVSKSNKYMAVTNNGQSVQSIQLIDPKSEKVLDTYVVGKSWYGLKFSDDNKYLYASGGHDNWILRFKVDKNKLNIQDTFVLNKPWPEKVSPAGIELDESRNLMFVVTKENNSLYIFDTMKKELLQRFELKHEAYTCQLSKDKKMLYISLWGGDQIACFNIVNRKFEEPIKVGDNPNEILLSNDGNTLYVANANDNSVSVIDIKNKKVLEVLNAALYPSVPEGSSTNGLALSKDQKTLYIANANNNCLAVFDVSKIGASKSKGFIPTGWYPTNVKVIDNRIFVSNGKGFSSFPNPKGPNPSSKEQRVAYQKGDTATLRKIQYIGGLMKGTMSIIDIPNESMLASYSKKVYANVPFTKEKETKSNGEEGNPIPMIVGQPSPIKHVFYIVKENRTYDQVLGDMPQGNGDPSLVLFGNKITPNQHKLASEFVLLDNFYVDGEVSADGHNWSLSAHATDYLEKNWPTNYGGRGGNYDGEGTREVANPKGGFLWDYAKRANVTYRTYGEFADDNKANIPVLENHFCPYFTSWDESVRDTTRFNQWRREFDSLLAINQVPQLNTLRFINDHTEGLKVGRPTVFAHVADNDWAVGLFVEHLSKSKIWDKSVVFIVEDDAQNGCDHVDAHRTTAYVAGGYVKRNFVDHTMYSTSSMLRTMELILGLPPMSQYDAAAEPMWRCFSKNVNLTPFESLPANVDLNDVNTALTASAKLSATFDFSKEDNIPDLLFSEVIWKAVRGEDSVMPAPIRSAFLNVVHSEEEEEDED